MAERTVTVPPYRPFTECDVDVVPVRRLSQLGKPQRRGETLMKVRPGIEHFSRAAFLFLYTDIFADTVEDIIQHHPELRPDFIPCSRI